MSDPPKAPFRELNASLFYVERAERQLHRAQVAHRDYLAERAHLNFEQGRPPPSLTKPQTDFEDAMTFAVVATRQCLRGRELLMAYGYALPDFRQCVAITALRDLDEHWDKWRGKEPTAPFPSDTRWLAMPAGRRWDRATRTRPEGQMMYTEERVTEWNGLDITAMGADLVVLEIAVRGFEIAAFEYEYVDEPTARKLTGEPLWGVLRRGMPFFPYRDEVRRMPRAELLAGIEKLLPDPGPPPAPPGT